MHINLSFKNIKLFRAGLSVLILSAFSMIAAAQTPCGETDYDCQIAEASQLIQANSASFAGYSKRAFAYYSKQNYDLAIKDYDRIIELQPQNSQAYQFRADAYRKLKNYDQAIVDYSKSIELDPQNSDAYHDRARSYEGKGKFALAVLDYNKAITLNPKEARFYFNRGSSLYNKGYYNEAIESYQKTLELDPNFPNAQMYINKAQAHLKEKKQNLELLSNILQAVVDAGKTTQNKQTQTDNTQNNSEQKEESNSNGKLNSNDVRRYVNEYEQEINPVGGISSPISFDITFKQIQFTETRAANAGDEVRGVKSAELYSVIVDYTLNQKFSDGTYPKHKKVKFEFYRNAQGGWSAFNYGPVE